MNIKLVIDIPLESKRIAEATALDMLCKGYLVRLTETTTDTHVAVYYLVEEK